MNSLKDIELRMSELQSEIEKDDADLDAIETEVRSLKEEKQKLIEKAEKREALIEAAKTQSILVEKQEERKEEIKMEINYRDAFLKRLQGHELNVEERAAITASAVIPTETLNRIVEKLEQTSALYRFITVLNVPSNLSIPVENVKNDAAWVAMGTAATDSADSFAAVSLAAHKLIKTIEIGADVAAMSIDAFESFIVEALAKKMAKAIENAIVNGTGSGQPTGLLLAGQITQTGTYTKAKMKYSDLAKIMALLPTSYHPNAAFCMPRKLFFEEVLGLETTDGAPAVVVDAQAPAKFNILGYPVIISDFMAPDKVLFGDFSYYYLNWSKPIEIRPSEEAAFRTGSVVYRSLALLDGKPVLADAFVAFDRSAT